MIEFFPRLDVDGSEKRNLTPRLRLPFEIPHDRPKFKADSIAQGFPFFVVRTPLLIWEFRF